MIDFLLLEQNKLVINQHYLINMKHNFNGELVLCILAIVAFIGACSIKAKNEYVDMPCKDKVINIDSIKFNTIDSVNSSHYEEITKYKTIIDSLTNNKPTPDTVYIETGHEAAVIANYKLERIRYYNNAAAKGNNIKYLRGWINRVLNEK